MKKDNLVTLLSLTLTLLIVAVIPCTYALNGFLPYGTAILKRGGYMDALIVVGSRCASSDLEVASLLASELNRQGGYVEVRRDVEVSLDELKSHNVVVIGGPAVNRLFDELWGYLSVWFFKEKGSYYALVGALRFDNPDIGVIDIEKSPFNTGKVIVVLAGNTRVGTKAAVEAFLSVKFKRGNVAIVSFEGEQIRVHGYLMGLCNQQKAVVFKKRPGVVKVVVDRVLPE